MTVVLGAEGGLAEGNLSAYLLAEKGTTDYLCLDAGTLLTGLRESRRRGSFKDVKPPPEQNVTVEGYVLRSCIRAYLISHAHLDHVAGLVIDSTDDGAKPILGLDPTIDYLRDSVFNWKLWPNFGSEGRAPLGKYTYVRMRPGDPVPVPGTRFEVEPFALSHGAGYPSTAFLVRAGEDYALYFGDTGPDPVERRDLMRRVWTRVAPLVDEGKLRCLFLEVSYPDGRADDQLYGHLTPSWILKELGVLAEMTHSKKLRGLPVIVTHIKPTLEMGPDPRVAIEKQLRKQNKLGVKFILPRQGDRLEF